MNEPPWVRPLPSYPPGRLAQLLRTSTPFRCPAQQAPRLASASLPNPQGLCPSLTQDSRLCGLIIQAVITPSVRHDPCTDAAKTPEWGVHCYKTSRGKKVKNTFVSTREANRTAHLTGLQGLAWKQFGNESPPTGGGHDLSAF